MSRDLINLLPQPRRARLVREYYLRFSVVVLASVVFVLIVAILLLIPSYLFLEKSVQAKDAQLGEAKSALSSADEVGLSDRLTVLSSEAEALTKLSHETSMSSTIRLLLSASHVGIKLSGITYTRGGGKNSDTLILSGTAQTRDNLRKYQIALQGVPGILSATLPVSAYAKDTNSTFFVTITLVP